MARIIADLFESLELLTGAGLNVRGLGEIGRLLTGSEFLERRRLSTVEKA